MNTIMNHTDTSILENLVLQYGLVEVKQALQVIEDKDKPAMHSLIPFDRCIVYAKRWFQKLYGNTYHSCRVYVDGELIGEELFTYGYGE